jgi:hypothetical protein
MMSMRRSSRPACSLAVAGLSLLLLVQPPQSCASPFDPHPLAAREPFVEGWFVRVVDHAANVSAAVIVGAFSNGSDYGGFGGPAGEAFVALLLQRPGHPPVTQQSVLHGSAGDVNVTKHGLPVTRPPVAGTPAEFEYRSAQGALLVTNNGSAAAIDFVDVVAGLRIEVNLSTRVPYSRAHPDADGPEGYLPDQLLPTHYWVQSLASQATYRITNTATATAAASTATAAPAGVATVVAAGDSALAHFEANWGSTFPSGWVWAEAILDEDIQLVLTGGNFTIAGVTTPQWIVSLRAPQLPNNGAIDFRTIDLDRFDTLIDCGSGAFEVNASSSPLLVALPPHTVIGTTHREAAVDDSSHNRRSGSGSGGSSSSDSNSSSNIQSNSSGRAGSSSGSNRERLTLRVSLRAPPASFSAPLFVPGRGGFSSSPGSIESYVAVAEVTVQRESDGVVLLDEVISLAALEFGGTAQCQRTYGVPHGNERPYHGGASPAEAQAVLDELFF